MSYMASIHFNYCFNPNKENRSVIKTSKTHSQRLAAEASDQLPRAERGDEGTAAPAAARGLPQRALIFTAGEKQLGALRTSATICWSRSV